MRLLDDYISKPTLKILATIEATEDDEERRHAIDLLGKSQDPEASRILISLWNKTNWREIKKAIFHALGATQQQRGTEFLITFIKTSTDLPLMREALLALGKSNSPAAGEFILSYLKNGLAGLRKECITALSLIPYFFYGKEILDLLNSNIPQYLQADCINALANQTSIYPFSTQITEVIQNFCKQNTKLITNNLIISLGKVANKNSLQILENLPLTEDVAQNQLLTNTISQVRTIFRNEENIQNVIEDLATKSDENGILELIARIDLTRIRKIISENNFTANIECILRAISCHSKSLSEDLIFLEKNLEKIESMYIAFLIKINQQFGNHFIDHLKKFSATSLRKIAEGYPNPNVLNICKNIILNSKIQNDKISAINILVGQGQMYLPVNPEHQSIANFIYEAFRNEKDDKLKKRLIRALGQIRFEAKNFLTELNRLLREHHEFKQSIYFCLEKIGNAYAKEALLSELDKILQNENENDIQDILRTLAKLQTLPKIASFNKIKSIPLSCEAYILKILGYNCIPIFLAFIEKSLDNKNFEIRILAIAAAKFNFNAQILKKIEPFLSHQNLSIKGRALDTLCAVGSIEEHLNIFCWLEKNNYPRNDCLKVFSSLVPSTNKNYSSILPIMDKLLKDAPGDLQDNDVWQSAINFRDNLETSLTANQETAPNNGSDLDLSLSSQITEFNNLSAPVQSVLRNVEVTWQNSTIFDHRVDKSTIIVELTKSIDMILQEQIGSKLFINMKSNLLREMQATIISLELHENRKPIMHKLRELKCEAYFDIESFPTHKMLTLCEAILSESILHNQQKTIDGLRAWALLILIFGRDINFPNYKIPARIKLLPTKKGQIEKLCQAMNKLQNLRNRAAHRETFLDKSMLHEVRENCIWLINQLMMILP